MSKEYNDLREPIDPDEALRRAVAATKPEAAAAQVSQDTTARWLLLALLGRIPADSSCLASIVVNPHSVLPAIRSPIFKMMERHERGNASMSTMY